MKPRITVLFAGFLIFLTSFSQTNPETILDTVETVEGPVILYKNFSWEFLGEEPVLLNIGEDSTGLFTEGWINDQIRGFNWMKPDSIRDTVLILTSETMPFSMPVPAEHMIRGFMYTHKGLDLRLKTGDTVRAAFDGVVRYSRYNRGGFGNLVIIRHYNGLETYYGHLSKRKVEVNQVVKAGTPVGLGGSSGRSRGPHLHFEVRYKDVPVDPLRMIDPDSCRLIFNTFPVRKEVFYPNDWDANAVYYKIKSGDTLGHLASKYHTSVKEICAMNKISAKTTLRIGRVLRVR
ncbi:MAG: peptidoglycan DD-metalloendopeptidase family protein [bacterium]